jgi:hypothetical protein
VIHGTADAAIDLELAQRLCSGLSNSRPLVTIEGGGHACNLTHPKLVNLVVQQFLAELALPIPRGGERRSAARRSEATRRFGERRDPIRAGTGRRILFPSDRRMAERRGHERRQTWRVLSPRKADS